MLIFIFNIQQASLSQLISITPVIIRKSMVFWWFQREEKSIDLLLNCFMHYFVLPEFVPAFALVKSKNVYLPLKPFLQQNWQSVSICVKP